jgi:hypothetical protein
MGWAGRRRSATHVQLPVVGLGEGEAGDGRGATVVTSIPRYLTYEPDGVASRIT